MNINKLKWRSRRSMLELDLYFDRFIQGGGLTKLTDDELTIYSKLLDEEDGNLLLLLQGKKQLLNPMGQKIIDKIRNFVGI